MMANDGEIDHTTVYYLLRNILMTTGVFDPALSLAGGALASSYSARNLSPRPNAWRNVWR